MYIEWETSAHFTEENVKATAGTGFTIRAQVRTRTRSWSLCPQPAGPLSGSSVLTPVFSEGEKTRRNPREEWT